MVVPDFNLFFFSFFPPLSSNAGYQLRPGQTQTWNPKSLPHFALSPSLNLSHSKPPGNLRLDIIFRGTPYRADPCLNLNVQVPISLFTAILPDLKQFLAPRLQESTLSPLLEYLICFVIGALSAFCNSVFWVRALMCPSAERGELSRRFSCCSALNPNLKETNPAPLIFKQIRFARLLITSPNGRAGN